jgi:hypothetical protein
MTIWVHNIKGISVSNGFRPDGCDFSIDTPAVTFGAGEEMAAINLAANQNNLSILSGGQASIGYSGYLTGSGHSGKLILICHSLVWELRAGSYSGAAIPICLCLGSLAP